MTIQVLGPGCDRCHTLSRNTQEAVRELGLDAQVEKVTDYAEIARHGIMAPRRSSSTTRSCSPAASPRRRTCATCSRGSYPDDVAHGAAPAIGPPPPG